MFSLIGSLDQDKWLASPKPAPRNKKDLGNDEPYESIGILRMSEITDDHMTLTLARNDGCVSNAFLYGVGINPFKEVANCYVKLNDKAVGYVISGIMVEEDWVKMKYDYLASFKNKTDEDRKRDATKKKKLVQQFSIDMGIVSDLDRNIWKKKGDVPRQKTKFGYIYYHIDKVDATSDPSAFLVHLSWEDRNGKPNQTTATIKDVQRNPFAAILNTHAKVETIGDTNQMTGIMFEGTWVEIDKD